MTNSEVLDKLRASKAVKLLSCKKLSIGEMIMLVDYMDNENFTYGVVIESNGEKFFRNYEYEVIGYEVN